jgi:hypothetical protein
MNNMRIFFLLLVLPLISLKLTAQDVDKSKFKNEIGLTLFSIKSNYEQWYSSSPYFSILNGIDYKRVLGKNAIRLGIDFRDRNDKGTGDFIATSRYREGRYRLGYHRLIGDKAIKPYFGNDFTYIHSKFQKEFSGGIWSSYLKDELKYNGFGFAPILGLKVQLYKTLSLSFETNLEFLWIIKSGTQTKNSPEDVNLRVTNSINSTKFVMRFNALNIASINYSF